MQTVIHGICLRVIKHSDTTSLATVWTRERGRLTLSLPSGKGREATRRRALMMPFSLFEGIATLMPGKEIARISDVRPFGGIGQPITNPVANVVAVFLSDFMYSVLRESPPDEHLTDFIFDSARSLAGLTGGALANFHIYFIYKLGHFLGIAPDMGTYKAGRYFDMREGVFTVTMPIHTAVLPPAEAKMVWTISRLKLSNLHALKLNRHERNSVLDKMLDYYSMHHTNVSSMSSLMILRSVMD